jgi:GTP-binding protein
MTKPLVALVGRPNAGKSTLFNRIVGERVAIVEDVAGTTRDRLYYDAEWAGREFTIVDTGGMEIIPGSDLGQRVRQQAEVAIAEADMIVFVTDAREGVTLGDEEVAQILRQTSKPVVVAVNKADTVTQSLNASEFYKLGLHDVYSISALHGLGTGDLLDAMVNSMPKPTETEEQEEEEGVRLALVGRPNVGKSSLLNALVGQERAVVSEIPGTTRDAIDVEMQVKGERLVVVDTAGVRRRGRIEQGIEKYSVLRSIRAIQRANVVAVLLDPTEGVTAQDTHLAGYAVSEAKGLLFVVNKWDLVPHSNEVKDAFVAQIRTEMRFAPYAPVVFISARQHWHLDEVISTVMKIDQVRHVRVPTPTLNDIIEEAVQAHGPSAFRGRTLKVYYATQVKVNPPTFVFFVNDTGLIHFSYQRFLENRLRQAFGFEGTAVRLIFRPKQREEGESKSMRAR